MSASEPRGRSRARIQELGGTVGRKFANFLSKDHDLKNLLPPPFRRHSMAVGSLHKTQIEDIQKWTVSASVLVLEGGLDIEDVTNVDASTDIGEGEAIDFEDSDVPKRKDIQKYLGH